MTNSVPNWPARMKQVMFSLFYPAILGTLLYDILLAGERANWFGRLIAPDHKLLIAGLLVLHFVVDFVLTQEVGGYRLSVFLGDIAIVVLLFIGYNGIHLHSAKDGLDVCRVALSLCGTYLCFLFWEYLMRKELGVHLDLVAFESVALIAFFLITVLRLDANWLAGSLAAATVAMGIIGGRILEKYHGPKPGT